MDAVALIERPWRDPVEAAAPFAGEPFALVLLTGGEAARWSYLAIRPRAVLEAQPDHPEPFEALADLIGPPASMHPDGPPFQGGVAGLCAYELGARAEGVILPRAPGWPDLACGRYDALLAFDHQARRTVAVGRGATPGQARAAAEGAAGWLDAPAAARPRASLTPGLHADDGPAYEAAVAAVIARIGQGEIFQANIARRWRARLAPGAAPFDLFARLARSSPAAFAAYFRTAAAAVVSNSPERFLRADAAGRIRAEPIKGTRPRGADRAADDVLAAALLASDKDRAENLMIVDLMRNDLARVCEPGGVLTPELYRLQSLPNVHHLVSTVTGQLRPGLGPADLLRATLPPGSITGAPKVQAMKVIAGLEPARGPFFGSIFWAGADGAMESSVLIRTAAFTQARDGWDVEARAGAGIVWDSDPVEERRETEAKIDAVRRALTEAAP